MKYKYHLDKPVRQIAEWQLANYPKDKRTLEREKYEMIQTPIQTYGGKVSTQQHIARPTEQTAIRILSAPYIRRMESNVDACDRVLRMLDPVDLRIIELLYWKTGESFISVCMKTNIEKSALYQRLNKILGSIAAGMGYYNGYESY